MSNHVSSSHRTPPARWQETQRSAQTEQRGTCIKMSHPQTPQSANRNAQREIAGPSELAVKAPSSPHWHGFNTNSTSKACMGYLDAPKRTVKDGIPVRILIIASSSRGRGK